MHRILRMVLSTAIVALVPACKGKEPPADTAVVDRALEDSLARVRAEIDEVRRELSEVANFAFDRSAIRAGRDRAALERKVAILQANAGLRIEIVGHCDARGPSAYNMALGQRRADAARRFLTERGIAGDRVTTRSRGEDQPLDPAGTPDAWARNRRVEFVATAGGDVLRRPPAQ